MAVETPTVLKTYFQTGDKPTQAQFVNLIDSAIPALVYVALLTQVGGGAPTAIVLENTLGEVPSLAYNAVGDYFLSTIGNVFTINKTFIIHRQIIMSAVPEVNYFEAKWVDPTRINLFTFDKNPALLDGILTNTEIEIRVYFP